MCFIFSYLNKLVLFSCLLYCPIDAYGKIYYYIKTDQQEKDHYIYTFIVVIQVVFLVYYETWQHTKCKLQIHEAKIQKYIYIKPIIINRVLYRWLCLTVFRPLFYISGRVVCVYLDFVQPVNFGYN